MLIEFENGELKLPDFLIIGAARSGTTSLYYSLRRHPGVFMPDLKEPFYLSFVDEIPEFTGLHFLRERMWTTRDYAELFAEAGDGQLLGEASTSYLYMYEKTIANIQQVYGRAAESLRLIAILRNPVERTFSKADSIAFLSVSAAARNCSSAASSSPVSRNSTPNCLCAAAISN